jgi:murein DD-endopeptidase MepM/ murein hydrolase activator NlpD
MRVAGIGFALMLAGVPASSQLPSGGLAIRFCPAAAVRAYPLNDARGLKSLLLQNTAIVRRDGEPAAIEEVDIQLLRGGEAIDERRLTIDDLRRFADAGRAMQRAGLLKLFSFQFCGTDMLSASTNLAGPTLGRNEAMIVLQEAFAYGGDRDTVRIRVLAQVGGRATESVQTLPIRTASSSHAFRFPLRGAWYVGAGASFHTAHRWAVIEEFALDLVKLGSDGLTHNQNGLRFEDYHAYGADVLAAGDGRVVSVVTDQTEDPGSMRQPSEDATAYLARLQGDQAARIAKGPNAVLGNAVVIDHGDDEFSMYLHLKPGSVRVKPGDSVLAGQIVGKLGSSGNSTEPHLHFEVCNRPEPMACAAIPLRFVDVTLPFADTPRVLQSGDVVIAKSP